MRTNNDALNKERPGREVLDARNTNKASVRLRHSALIAIRPVISRSRRELPRRELPIIIIIVVVDVRRVRSARFSYLYTRKLLRPRFALLAHGVSRIRVGRKLIFSRLGRPCGIRRSVSSANRWSTSNRFRLLGFPRARRNLRPYRCLITRARVFTISASHAASDAQLSKFSRDKASRRLVVRTRRRISAP